ncbi:MAG: AAA family ATPase [Microcystaceae cyanobacterium]
MSKQKQPRLLSFTLDGWPVLGDKVSVSLVDGVAILVGRNGVGKSAILEGFEAILSYAIGRLSSTISFNSHSIPSILEIEISTPTERLLRYRYQMIVSLDANKNLNNNSEDTQFSFNEDCRYIDQQKEIIWQTERGITTLSNKGNQILTMIGNTSSFLRSHISENSKLKLPQEIRWVYNILKGVNLLRKIPACQTYQRKESLLRISPRGINYHSFTSTDNLAYRIFRMNKEELNELTSICQRIGLGSQLNVEKFIPSEVYSSEIRAEKEYIAEVSLDGINIGLLSDGTIQILSIITDLIFSFPSRTLIIEEPETQIHPEMLANLLNELESYTYGENLIISTHSTQVVSWTRPDKINLVYREQGRTIVRKLQSEEIQQVATYLSEEGNLGEWIYSGIIEEYE